MEDSRIHWLKKIRQRLNENSFENLVWLINFMPSFIGFPLLSKKFGVTYWIIHIVLLFYIYVTGVVVYYMRYAEDFVSLINSFFNITAFVVISNTSWWIVFKRKELNHLLELVKNNDDLVIEAGRHLDVHQQLLKRIKIIVIMCFIFHFVNDIIVFIPARTIGMDNFSIVSCVGLEPLSASPYRETCMGILAVQIFTSAIAVVTFDAILLFLFSHITAVFQILYEDMQSIDELAYGSERYDVAYSAIEERLKNLVIRHILVLQTVNKLEGIYSTGIGIHFGIDAISLCIFFVLPLDVSLNFAPLVYHSLFIFFMYCLQGQRLTTASEKFEMAVYCCCWEKFRSKERRHLLLMLKQAQKPVVVHAARVIPIRLYTFANIMEFIYKFVTIFKI